MPAALDVDYSQAKLIYASTGSYKVASEQTGISYDAIRQRACREEWPVQVQKATELVSHRVTEALGMARLSMEERSQKVRDKHATVAERAADELANMDGQELLLMADTALKYAKHGQAVFGWQQNVTTTLRLDVLASGSSDSAPVIDV